jgi:hypothetical protein
MSDWWNQPTRPTVDPAPSTSEPLAACAWCAAPAKPEATHCINCGAVMAQHEDLGGLVIAGVTAIDPAMNAGGYGSTLVGSQSRMSALNAMGTSPAGAVAQVVAGAAMLATDRPRGLGGSAQPEDVGKPSQAALDMAQRLRRPSAQADELQGGSEVSGEDRQV